MSKHQKPIKFTAFLSILIIICMVFFAFFYLCFSQQAVGAAQDIWQHFKTLSLIVVGYWFGSNSKN